MANESNLKLKVKVDTSELDKLSSKLKGMDTGGGLGGESGSTSEEPVAAKKAKKVKVATEELTKAQQFAAEVSKILSEEQSQLATNVDSTEIAQKALGAALQSFAGVSAVAIGATLAIGSAVYQLRGQYKELDDSLAANGASWSQYINSLIQGRDLTNSFGLRQSALAGGIRLTGDQLDQYAGSIERLKRVVGSDARDVVEKAFGLDPAAARRLGVVWTDQMTALEKRQAVIRRMNELNAQESAAVAEGARIAAQSQVGQELSIDVGMGGEAAINAEAAGRAAADARRAASESANRAISENAQQTWALVQDIVDRGVVGYQNSMAAIQAADDQRIQNYLNGQGTLEISDRELNNRRIGLMQALDNMRVTSDMDDAQRAQVRQARQAAQNQILQLENEIRNRGNTVQGIRDRLYRESLARALSGGASINRLERLSISNAQIRIQLEAKLAELRAKLVTLTGQSAEAVRREIAGILQQFRSLNTGSSSPTITLTEIRNLILQINKASAESAQSDFIRGIQNGTLSIEEQMQRLNALRNQRTDAEQRNREALIHASSLAEQLENATTNRERQRLAIQQRKANEEVTRTQETLRTVSASYDAAGQAIARSISERENKAEQERINAEKLAYDSRARILQNQTRDTQDALGRNRTIFDAWIADQQGSATDYQRSIANMFNPEQMIAEIQQGVQQAGALVSQESARLAQMQASRAAPEELANQTQRVVDAQRAQTQATRESEQAISDLHERMRDASPGTSFVKSLTNGAKGMANMASYAGGLAAQGLNAFSDGVWAAMDAIKQGENVGDAVMAVLSTTLQSIGQEATIKALMETAAGIAATFTPGKQAEAGGHFAAAGVYASVAALAGVGYMALPSPPSKEGKEKESTTTDRELLNAQRREQNIVINGSAYMTKEELSKAARKIADYGKDL